jgi:hypothetical protein
MNESHRKDVGQCLFAFLLLTSIRIVLYDGTGTNLKVEPFTYFGAYQNILSEIEISIFYNTQLSF